jgi:hypothetical protein
MPWLVSVNSFMLSPVYATTPRRGYFESESAFLKIVEYEQMGYPRDCGSFVSRELWHCRMRHDSRLRSLTPRVNIFL